MRRMCMIGLSGCLHRTQQWEIVAGGIVRCWPCGQKIREQHEVIMQTKEKLTREYVKRAPRREEKIRCSVAVAAANMLMMTGDVSEVEVNIKNKQNPNGFTIQMGKDFKPKVLRNINLAWARKRGYVDTYFTSTGRRAPRRPRLTDAELIVCNKRLARDHWSDDKRNNGIA